MQPIIQNIIQFLPISAVLCYLLGFITVRAYLAGYNITTISLLQVRYISVGLLFLLITIIPLISLLIFDIKKVKTNTKTINFFNKRFSYILATVLCKISKKRVKKSNFFSKIFKNIIIIPIISIIVYIILYVTTIYYIFVLYSNLKAIPNFVKSIICSILRSKWTGLEVIFSIVVVIALILFLYLRIRRFIVPFIFIFYMILILMSHTFAEVLYILIPASFGGGYPTEVRLLIDAKKIDANQLNLFEKTTDNEDCLNSKETKKTCVTRDLVMIEELDKSYIVLARNKKSCLDNNYYSNMRAFLIENYKVFHINKDLVQGIEYSMPFFSPMCASETAFKTALLFETNEKYNQANNKFNKKIDPINLHVYINDTSFFMNLYNRHTQLLEIKDAEVKESKINDWTIYTYISSKPKKTTYIKVNAKINLKENKSEIELFTPDGSRNLINGYNTVALVKNSSCDKANYTDSVTDNEFTLNQNTKIFSQPNSNSEVVYTVPKGSPLTVKLRDRVCNLGDSSLWYEVFYKYNKLSTTRGWILYNSIQSTKS